MTHAYDDDRGPTGPDPEGAGSPEGPRSVVPAGSGRAGKKHLPLWQEMFLLLGLALVLAVGIKALLVQAFYIPSGSMNDTLVLDDRILVEKVSSWGGDGPQRGDVVVFSDPGGWLDAGVTAPADNPLARTLEVFGLYPTGGHLVKRVIGVGGDSVVCCDRQGRIRVNDVPLEESAYLAEGEKPSLIRFDVEVPEGYLWVQGDNRSNSADSRAHLGDPGGGMIPVEDVVGKVFAVVWPFDNAGLLDRPDTFAAVPAAP